MTWKLVNRSDSDLVFFIVLNGIVGAGSLGESPLQATAINGDFTHAQFFAGKHRLSIEGFDKLWGPWQGPHQVVQVSLKSKAHRTLKLTSGETSPAERLQILKLKAVPSESDLVITSPRNLQVIQRRTRESGRVLVSGRVNREASTVEIRFVGAGLDSHLTDWQPLHLQPNTRQFSIWKTLSAGGWYRLEARALKNGNMIAEEKIARFGIGEVFVGAGQSNSTNSGQFKTQQTTGKVSSFSGTDWQLADDPQPGVADRSQGGSFWPAFGDAMVRQFDVPIGVATTGYGGTSVNQWQPDGDLFRSWMMERIHQLGPQGFRAVLWHQGEADVNMPAVEYQAKLKNTILASTKHAGWEFPWFVAQATYHNAEKPRFESIRTAQKNLCDNGIAILGPDTDTLTGDHRDFEGKGIHFSPKGLKAHGQMWAEKVIPYVESELAAP